MVFIRWLKAVGAQWWATVTGGVIVLFLALYSEISGTSVDPRVYEGVAVFALLQAMFLAWIAKDEALLNAERRNSRLEADIPRLQVTTPGWATRLRPYDHWGQPNPTLVCRFEIEIINSGSPTSLRDWQGGYVRQDGSRVFLSDAMFDRNTSTDSGFVNLVADERILERGGRRLGWVQFPVSEEDSRRIRQVFVHFSDHTGVRHHCVCPPELIPR
jgi:hypothetical protein